MEAGEGFNYAILDRDETELLGCVYDLPARLGRARDAGADLSWWVVDSAVGSDLERALDRTLPGWLADIWGIRRSRAYP